MKWAHRLLVIPSLLWLVYQSFYLIQGFYYSGGLRDQYFGGYGWLLIITYPAFIAYFSVVSVLIIIVQLLKYKKITIFKDLFKKPDTHKGILTQVYYWGGLLSVFLALTFPFLLLAWLYLVQIFALS